LLEFGADINAATIRGSTPLHTCMYFCNIDSFKELIKYKPKIIEMVDSSLDPTMQGQTAYTPITSCLVRDKSRMWNYVIEQQDNLIELGFKELTIGSHNFEYLLY
jgi:ankyrin repeat protein